MIIMTYPWTGFSSLSIQITNTPFEAATALEGVTKLIATASVAIAEQTEWNYGPRKRTTIFVREAEYLPAIQDDDGFWEPVVISDSLLWVLPELERYASA